MSKQLHNNIEAMRLQSPEFLTGHRQATIANAVQNLRIHAPAETPQPEKSVTSLSEQEIQAQFTATQDTRQAEQFRQDTSVDRIMQNVDAIFEGQGNPLYDQKTI